MDAREVAQGLTEAQRAWVLSPDRNHLDFLEAAHDDEQEWDDMAKIGVSEYWTDRLTPLGLAVRAYLEANPTPA
ncbi:MAG: hypothetical protein E6Q97_06270 [Desulfurellales bacterium]|nr:MAG: hypothetical protein E6Q97_06270 [Desulfurellales bacterium]